MYRVRYRFAEFLLATSEQLWLKHNKTHYICSFKLLIGSAVCLCVLTSGSRGILCIISPPLMCSGTASPWAKVITALLSTWERLQTVTFLTQSGTQRQNAPLIVSFFHISMPRCINHQLFFVCFFSYTWFFLLCNFLFVQLGTLINDFQFVSSSVAEYSPCCLLTLAAALGQNLIIYIFL